MVSIIPDNFIGNSLDVHHSVEDITLEDSLKTFARAQARLLNPNVWNLLTGDLNTKFVLHDFDGLETRRLVRLGDYLKIDIPGPGSESGGGFDWVKVDLLEENTLPDCDSSLVLRLRAAINPQKAGIETAHFFTAEATSTFIIKRIGNTVYSSYYGRNETANTQYNSMFDKFRNLFVAAGSKLGLSKIQWNTLTKNVLEAEIGG